MRLSRWIVPALLMLSVLAGCAGESLPPTISPRDAHSRLESGQNVVLLDVRTPEEWSQDGHSPAAILIPLDELESRAETELNKDDTIIVVCRTGNRSQIAAEYLREAGFSRVTEVEGGMRQWAAAGLPIACDVAVCGLSR